MSTFLIRPILSYDDVKASLNRAFLNMTKHGPEEDDCVSPYEVFQAVAAALETRIWEMAINDLEEVTFRQSC